MRTASRPTWAKRLLLDELRDQARRYGVEDAERLSRTKLVTELRNRGPRGRTDPYGPNRRWAAAVA